MGDAVITKVAIPFSAETVAEQTVNDGQSLLDEMSRPIKNAFGKDISPDYTADIKRIQRSLEELQERKLRCDELADVRRLKLQQLLQLRTCERDCDQVRISHVNASRLEFMIIRRMDINTVPEILQKNILVQLVYNF